MKKLLFLLIPLLLLAGCQQEGPSNPSSATSSSTSSSAPQVQLTPGMVTPGTGAGGVAIGQARADVEKVLGNPSEVSPNDYVAGQVFSLYKERGMELVYQDDKLAALHLHAPQKDWPAGFSGAIEEGVGPGSTAMEILEKLGEPDEKKPQALLYTKKGLVFRLDKDGKWATTVSVQAPEL